MRVPRTAVAALTLTLAATGCGASDTSTFDGRSLTLGYFPNITHAPALVGVGDGILADALDDVELSTQTFNSGPDAVNALFSGEIDAALLGPNPAVNGWYQSEGKALHIVAGAATQGTGLVVDKDITSVDELPGTTLATPQLGGTQDVALRWFAEEQGWQTDTAGGGAISVMPRENPEIVNAFRSGDIDGAWLPEPHLSLLLAEDDTELLVHEPDLWPESDGHYVTTHLVVGADYLERHPENVEALLQGHLASIDRINHDPEEAQMIADEHMEEITGGRLGTELTASAFDNITFTVDPVATSLLTGAERAATLGLLDPTDLTGIYALDPLNAILTENGREPVSGLEG